MGDIVDLTARLQARHAEEHPPDMQLVCPCQSDQPQPGGFYPMVNVENGVAVVVSLVCEHCGRTGGVFSGRLCMDSD